MTIILKVILNTGGRPVRRLAEESEKQHSVSPDPERERVGQHTDDNVQKSSVGTESNKVNPKK